MTILLLGANGMLAHDLQKVLQKTSESVVPKDLPELDITSESQVQEAIQAHKPEWVINCAAYTQVDQAETDVDLAHHVNATGPKILAKACAQNQVQLAHVSTDFVFDGNASEPYLENDITHPLGVYGESKLAGEQAIQAESVSHFIVRTSWLYGVAGKNFVKTMIRLAHEHPEIRVVNDQHGCPTWTQDLSHAIVNLMQQNASGLFHFCNQGVCSWYDFAKAAVEDAYELQLIPKVPNMVGIPSSEYPTPAKRPAYSAMNTQHYSDITKQAVPEWRSSLQKMLQALKKS